MAQDVTKGIRRILGSVKVEVAPLGSDSWSALGPGEGAGLTEELKTDEYVPDNAGTYGLVLLDQIDTVDFMAVEPDFEAFQIARGGIDAVTTIVGTLVSGNTQTVASGAWEFEKFIPFDLQNADHSAPTMDVTHPCLAGTDGDLVSGTDFDIIKVGNTWGAVIHDTATVTTASQMVTFKYSATPAASVVMSTGGANEIDFIRLRLTNTNPESKKLQVEYYRAQIAKGFQLDFGADKGSAKPNMWVFQFKAYRDETRATKDQLRKITFEL